MGTIAKYADLNKDELGKLKDLEKEIDKIVLAYDPEMKSPYAELNDAQVEKIRVLERELGVVLLAYKSEL